MSVAKTVPVLERPAADEIDPADRVSVYDLADPYDPDGFSRRESRFLSGVLEEVDREDLLEESRLLDHVSASEAADRIDSPRGLEADVRSSYLLALPDESILFLGQDPTARFGGLFSYVLGRGSPFPEPRSIEEALDLLRPGQVRDAFEDGDTPARQGEWWLIPTRAIPVGRTFQPGISRRPYGPGPLGNHVPTEWGLGVSASAFVDRFHDRYPRAPSSLGTPLEIFSWLDRHGGLGYAPDEEALQDLAGTIFVRGTLKHREADHYDEPIGEEWHKAVTHDVDVYTGDDVGVRLD